MDDALELVVLETTREEVAKCARWWFARFGDVAPLGYALREACPELWCRIHHLPDARRYPEDAEDWREALRRHNAAATRTLGDGACCWVIAAQWSSPHHPPALAGLPHDAWQRLELIREEAADPMRIVASDTATFWAQVVRWRPGAFDAMIRDSAQDMGTRFVFVQPDAARVWAPYDGGADLFGSSRADRDALAHDLQQWRSSRADGL